MTTILLVDDEALVREELGGFLEEEGYFVLTASDGQEGLEKYRVHRPQMVITDAKMPRREGLSLAREILAEDPHLPITMITGHGSESMAIEALRLGITDFIKKPVMLSDLLTALQRMETALRLSQMRPGPEASLPTSAHLVERSAVYHVANDMSDVPSFVSVLISDLAGDFGLRKREGLQLALREIMLNAIEHGNLCVSFAEKTEATENGTVEELISDRLGRAEYKDRRVHVAAKRTDDALTITVRDEGAGFDWKSLPDPTDPANLLRSHGRGVLLANLSVDAVTFNQQGNEVTLTSFLDKEGGRA